MAINEVVQETATKFFLQKSPTVQFDSSPTQSPCGILKWSKENWLLIGSLIPEKGVYTNATILKIGAYSAK